MKICAAASGRVRCQAELRFNLPAACVWGQARDFARFASHDYFHRNLRVEGGVPRQGARLHLSHQYAGIRTERIGRILRWREGEGFAFSDLSRRGARSGFPHIFRLQIEPVDDRRCLVHLTVRGLWTARWIPLLFRRMWLAWVFAYIVSRTRNDLVAYQVARHRRQKVGIA